MEISWSDITVEVDELDVDLLLSDWRWLVDEKHSPMVITAMGDLFLEDEQGQVVWLDVAAGQLNVVAESIDQWKDLINEDGNADLWFSPEAVVALREHGIVLGPRQVYSLTHPAILGGEFDFDNITAANIYVHFCVQGQIHEQVKDLPPGTEIDSIEIQEPEID